MKHSLTLLLLFTLMEVQAQSTDTAYLQWIYATMRKIQPTGTLYYADRVPKSRIKYMRKTAKDQLFLTDEQGLELTRAEKKYLWSAFKKIPRVVQPDHLFDDSERIGADTLTRFVEQIGRRKVDALRQLPDSNRAAAEYWTKEKPWAFTFSNPAYLRGNTLRLHYFQYYANSSGEVGVWIYKKEGEKWTRLYTLGGGAW